ncbi:catalase B [Aspergillus lentulus]|uniref:Catalase n=1 Tax=Aspergillus lentulus TaxID=293939 RepID=A0AAN4T8N9_ASPLE|nr:catalase B [Aspergillus lentulus]GAQ05121.1 catalase B [Aspergillus lentulus]GFF49175.1 catalase B [Aspergillus lentulus]GFF92149.1 catalase B [Aspergillus lentulus]GFG11204.1 catalase B [Aspergillus lentulus]
MRLTFIPGLIGVANAVCPYMTGELNRRDEVSDGDAAAATEQFLSQYYLSDNDTFMTSDVGGPIEDQNSLSAGERGPTLLEDFIFRQKIQRFDHERVPERAVHARGAGAHGVFTSYGDFSNITAASFLGKEGKQTPVFVRFSTVAGSRGSSDLARDVHGFATRFYTDEGNFDIVGNNIPVFFIQDAILFPDLIHAVKPRGDNEIPQAASAHDSAWDFFSQQPSTMHTLLWAMSGHGIPRSFRHVDGFGVHTFRFVTDDGASKLVKFHWKSLQGKASMVWEEAQQTSGKNPDFMRQDLYDAIEAGRYPEWELGVQIMDEEDQLRFGFDLLDPTKIVPEEFVPITKLGKMQLNRNPRNYFAETEQVMFQPGHIVRGVDFTEDPLLQGRLFSYLDTQLNRHGGPNFEQLPINQPRVPVHNNNRDGAGQMFIPLNPHAYSPKTPVNGSPKQANQTVGDGFFTAPGRTTSGKLVRAVSPSFADVWSQPRLFYNSLVPAEKQFVIDAIRFENANVKSPVVKNNVIIQLNRIDNDLARRVARAIGVAEPEPDPTFYHNNKTANVGTFGTKLKKLDGLKVGVLGSVQHPGSVEGASTLRDRLKDDGVDVVVVAERLANGVDQTYSASDAIQFDAVVVAAGAESLFTTSSFTGGSANATTGASSLYPTGRPLQILVDGFRFGKTVGALGSGAAALRNAGIATSRDGVYVAPSVTDDFANGIKEGLSTFKFLDRFPVDH